MSHDGYGLGQRQYGPIPPHSMRIVFDTEYSPVTDWTHRYDNCTCTQLRPGGIHTYPNVWDITLPDSQLDWGTQFRNDMQIREVWGGRTERVTGMTYMFAGCIGLTTVEPFPMDSTTSLSHMFDGCRALTTIKGTFAAAGITDMSYMFYECTALTQAPAMDTGAVQNFKGMFSGDYNLAGAIPLYPTASATDMTSMFSGCWYVESGALALYQQASSQANPPASHSNCFDLCGAYTTTGAAELAEIPADWK